MILGSQNSAPSLSLYPSSSLCPQPAAKHRDGFLPSPDGPPGTSPYYLYRELRLKSSFDTMQEDAKYLSVN